MKVKVGYSTPLLHVAAIERSIRFYEALGFQTVDTDRATPLGWARLHCEGGALMFLRAEEPVDAAKQSVRLYMYTPDLPALRKRLIGEGLQPSTIRHPPYMPSGEMSLTDPDGYVVLIAHWGPKEHSAWQERLLDPNA